MRETFTRAALYEREVHESSRKQVIRAAVHESRRLREHEVTQTGG